MRTHADHDFHHRSQLIADLQSKTAAIERQLADARVSLDRELAGAAHRGSARNGAARDAAAVGRAETTGERTQILLNHGRTSVRPPVLPRGRKIAAVLAALVLFVAILVMIASSGGPSWPASVARVQAEISTACGNPDIKSEPGQVNFACASSTRQILWVFALLTSGNNAGFSNPRTGRQGLEPITPAQGGEIAWSLNLHHPYDPLNPIDSLMVAARAINNIVGGATLTGSNGAPVVQAGLESEHGNCLRYTGSVAVTSQTGYPRLCARPITSPAGQAALVSDVYQKWVVGAAPQAAQNAAVLFSNAKNPGDPRVQAILNHVSASPTPA
jgi:hypothetical protein